MVNWQLSNDWIIHKAFVPRAFTICSALPSPSRRLIFRTRHVGRRLKNSTEFPSRWTSRHHTAADHGQHWKEWPGLSHFINSLTVILFFPLLFEKTNCSEEQAVVMSAKTKGNLSGNVHDPARIQTGARESCLVPRKITDVFCTGKQCTKGQTTAVDVVLDNLMHRKKI